MTHDLTGRIFGQITVLARAVTPADSTSRDARWLCRCECGGQTIVRSTSLLVGNTKSCGCGRGYGRLDLTGHVFGRLTALTLSPPKAWLCRCSCGRSVRVRTENLRSGNTNSCGICWPFYRRSLPRLPPAAVVRPVIAALEASPLSRAEIARRAGITPATLNNWLSGRSQLIDSAAVERVVSAATAP